MSTFGLDPSSTTQNIIDAINYAVSNLGQGGSASFNGNVLTANTATGQITTTTTNGAGYSSTSVISYLYQYMDVKYANTATGGGFTSNCRNTQYFGLYNTNSTTIDTNPTDYIWYQVTGGFGLTKNLWYQTTGGRQVAFFAGNAAPAPNYIPVPDNTPLNLDSITSVQNNQIVNVNAYFQANTTPATPSGGTYNFSTFTLTPPTGWSASIPSTNSNTTVYVSQAAFVGNSISTVGPSTLWTTPAAYIQQFQGNTGPAGQRGFIPMGYVICSTDPATFSNPTDYSTAFAAARTNASPPIGLGFDPIANDTAQFFYANLFSGVNTTTVRQFNGNIWVNVDAQVISGGLFVPGTITANTLNANQVYALTVTGGNVTPGINSGYGYWLTANVGNAYFGGTVDIGNNLIVGQDAQFGSNLNIGTNAFISDTLTVGNNASIGRNLQVGTNATIGGVIIGGALADGTVGNTQIIPNSINANFAILDGSIGNTKIGNDAITTGKIAVNAITANTIQSNAITAGKIAADAVTSNTIAANAITTGKIAANAITGNTIQANTIQGTSIVAGSITSTQLSANIIISGNIISFGQTIESPTGVGYWLDYTNGNVYFGGNTVIGNSLKIGNNPNIGTGLTVGASAVIGNNLTVGQNAQIGANLNIGTNAVVGNNLTVGQNAQIGANLNVGTNLTVGTFATIGSNLTVQNNATIGNNLSVGTNATIGGVIIGGVLGPNTVGNTQVASGLNGALIASGTIGTTQIGSNAITTSLIAANAITATQIAAGSIYAGAIQAGAVTATTIAAGAVTAGAIGANAVTAGTIAAGAIIAGTIGANAVTAGTIAAGAVSTYSLQANSVVAGTIAANAISAYSLQANSVTGNAINANTITTTNLVFNSATGSGSLGPTYPGTYPITFYNNGVTNPTASDYLWPQNTRGFAQDHGLSYIPQLSGNIIQNTRLVIVYSGYVFSGNAATLVELWKSGGSTYYQENYTTVTTMASWSGGSQGIANNNGLDMFYTVGSNGFVGYSYTNGNTWLTERSTGTLSSGIYESVAGYYYSGSGPVPELNIGLVNNYVSFTTSNAAPTALTTVANVGTTYSMRMMAMPMATDNNPWLCVGSNGVIYRSGWFGSSTQTKEASGTLATLYSVDTNTAPEFSGAEVNNSNFNMVAVAVGSNGTILRNTYVVNYAGGYVYSPVSSGWTSKNSGVVQNLYGVRCNWANLYSNLNAPGNLWVAVGQNGIILTSPDGNTWTQQVSPTSQDLLSVTYGNGYWCAVGNNSTIVYSTDGVTWTAIQGPIGNDGVYRNLNSVTFGFNTNTFVAVGQSIIIQSRPNPTNWSTRYDAGVSVASTFTRLTAFGSDGANIANVTIPSLGQQLGSQVVSNQYVDYNYTAGVPVTYYIVMGNLTGNAVQTNSATLQVTEFKR